MKSAMLGSTSWALDSLLCSATRMQKQKTYSDSPRNSTTFEYKVNLLLSSPLAPPLNTNPNVVPYQIHTISICVPKKLFFLDFHVHLNKPDSAKFSDSYPDLARFHQIWRISTRFGSNCQIWWNRHIWPSRRCHVVPPHWATCHLVIGPNHITMHSHIPHVICMTTSSCPISSTCHLYGHVSLPHHCSYGATSSSVYCHVIVHTMPHHPPYNATSTSVQCHINICTATCHHATSLMYSATCHFHTGPTQPENANIDLHVSAPGVFTSPC
jgi:hypothetical protein